MRDMIDLFMRKEISDVIVIKNGPPWQGSSFRIMTKYEEYLFGWKKEILSLLKESALKLYLQMPLPILLS